MASRRKTSTIKHKQRLSLVEAAQELRRLAHELEQGAVTMGHQCPRGWLEDRVRVSESLKPDEGRFKVRLEVRLRSSTPETSPPEISRSIEPMDGTTAEQPAEALQRPPERYSTLKKRMAHDFASCAASSTRTGCPRPWCARCMPTVTA